MKYKWFGWAFVLSFAFDQATKIWARTVLRPKYPGTISVIPNYWDFQYSENRGSAFSLVRDAGDARWLFVAAGVVALGAILFYLRRTDAAQRLRPLSLGLVAGGALGNLLDRGVFGFVTDFVVWHVGAHRWPTFNIADAALLLGVVGLLFEPRPAVARKRAT
jgi:signal peptidase II